MKVISSLRDWSYPVIDNGKQLKFNCESILCIIGELYNKMPVQFVGRGGSGAMILGALSCINNSRVDHKFILLRKPQDNTNRGRDYIEFYIDYPIVVVDDHITYGHTLTSIRNELKDLKVLNKVEVAVMNEWKGCSGWFEKNKERIEEIFPNLKLWIH